MRMKKNMKKSATLLISLALLLLVTAGATLAYYFTKTKPVENTFTPSKVACAVVENGTAYEEDIVLTGTQKSTVQIKNTGDTNAYIRAAVVVNWMNEDGTKVWAQAPVLDTDYKLEYHAKYLADPAWELGSDGYYYHKGVVSTGHDSNPFIISAEVLTNPGPVGTDGTQYYLSIEIVAEAIQAEGIDASYTAQQAWQLAAAAN